MKMYYGQKRLMINEPLKNKPKETTMHKTLYSLLFLANKKKEEPEEKPQLIEAPDDVINSFNKSHYDESKKFVDNHYKKNTGRKLQTQIQVKPLESYPALPCLGGTKEEE